METSYIRMVSIFPIIVETLLIFPIPLVPGPISKKECESPEFATMEYNVATVREILENDNFPRSVKVRDF